MNNDINVNKNDFIDFRNEINQDLGKFKSLSQKERKILKVAIESFKDGKEAVISKKIANKLSQPSTYEKNIFNSIGKAIEKVFNREYIDANELSTSLNALPLEGPENGNELNILHDPGLLVDESDSGSTSDVLEEAEHLEEEAQKYEAEAAQMDQEVEKLEAEVRKLEAELDKPEVVESAEIDKVPDEKPHTVNEANRVMWKIMGNAKPVEGTGEIIIAGQVLGDGRGDWAAIRNMHKILSKKFPDRPIRVIANSDEKWKGKLDVTGMEEHCHLIYSKGMGGMGTSVPLEAFDARDEILKKAQEASILISAGVSMNTVFESIEEQLKEKSIKMKEHDTGSTYLGQQGEIGDTIIQAGLNVQDDRMGVFAKSNEKMYKWSNLSSPNLLSALFNSEVPDENAINSYLDSHECFFGYAFSTSTKYMFAQDAFKFAKGNSPDKVVDICMPGSCDRGRATLEQWEASTKRHFERTLTMDNGYDVGKVHLIWFENGEKQEKTIILNDNITAGATKEIRLIDPGSISNRDFKIMTKISGPIVACTGDNSLAQTLSYGKIPFYENRFTTKWRAFLSKIKEQQGEDSALYQYCSNLRTMGGYGERPADSLNNITKKGLEEEAKNFGEYIRNEANLKPIFKGVVNEKLLRQEDPDFAEKQDALMQKYLKGAITQKELEAQFTALLAEKGLL